MPSQKALRAPSWVTWAKALAPLPSMTARSSAQSLPPCPSQEFSAETQDLRPDGSPDHGARTHPGRRRPPGSAHALWQRRRQEPSDLVTLPLTAAPGQTNGVIELTYDPALLTLERIQGQAEVVSYQHHDGSLKLGYAWAAGAAEGAAYAHPRLPGQGPLARQR